MDALVLNDLTAWQMLHRAAQVQAGQSVLVLGAAGGVGSALVELAHLAGARVHGTASPRRHAALRTRGVKVVADQNSVPELVDAVFDPVGGPSLARSRKAARTTGVVVSYGFSFTVDAGRSRAGGLIRTLAALVRATASTGARLVLYRAGSQDPAALLGKTSDSSSPSSPPGTPHPRSRRSRWPPRPRPTADSKTASSSESPSSSS